MIDLSTLKPMQVSGVPLGCLVLYVGKMLALRVETAGDDVPERQSLLVLGAEVEIASEIGNDLCLSLGKPVICWDGASELTPFESGSVLPAQATLVLLRDGPAIVSSTSRDRVPTPRLAWNAATGKQVSVGRGFALNSWTLGVLGIDGKFVRLLT